MKIEINYTVCESNAICMAIVPEVFEVDDDDNVHILQPELTPDTEGQVRDAIAQCPRAAISLAE
jgi:ferredoxin